MPHVVRGWKGKKPEKCRHPNSNLWEKKAYSPPMRRAGACVMTKRYQYYSTSIPNPFISRL